MDKISKIRLSDLKIGEWFGRSRDYLKFTENCEVIKRNKNGTIKVKIRCGSDFDFVIFDYPASKIVFKKNEN